jgi:hypothetical protein
MPDPRLYEIAVHSRLQYQHLLIAEDPQAPGSWLQALHLYAVHTSSWAVLCLADRPHYLAAMRLSPAYDMNPSIDHTELTLAINEVETACDVSIAMDARKDYGMTAQQADRVLLHVQTAVHDWRNEASQLRIPKAEQDLLASALEL